MGSVNCLRRRRRQASQADNNLAKIAIHEKPAQRQLVASLPVAMSTAARQGAPRNQEVVNLISDDENSESDFADFEIASPSPDAPAPTPLQPGQQNEPLPPQPGSLAPLNPPNPLQDENLVNANNWEDVVDVNGINGFDGFDDMDIRDPELERVMMESYNLEARIGQSVVVPYRNGAPLPSRQNGEPSGHNQENMRPIPSLQPRAECVDLVMSVFPGICRDYVSNLYNTTSQSSDVLIALILDRMDKGGVYPNAKKELEKSLKRKRQLDEDEKAARKYGAVDRIMPPRNRPFIRTLLSYEFAETSMAFIDACLHQAGNRLFSAYRVLEEAQRTYDPKRPAYNKIKTGRKALPQYKEEGHEQLVQSHAGSPHELEILEELQAARRIRRKGEAKRQAERQLEIEEEDNVRRAEAEGTMAECGCCFGDFPLNRMTHCDNDEVMHWFCRACARTSAETEIGNSKYKLRCMSMDGCEAGFSIDQRSLFLDANTTIALERNEQEAVLRMAGIENLASCPFCPYAAEYPPVDIDREFRCQAPDCEKVSCRLCKLESHIPKSCEEHAKENGLSIRRQIEEAMSAALIRKCNKCSTPFVKEEGCNKMTCTRNGCRNVQCYVCSKSCGYDHFNDERRGGRVGNCPLFESVEQRHEHEVRKAEKEVLDKVRAEHPEYSEEDLKVKVSEKVMQDEERRRGNNPVARFAPLQPGGARYRGFVLGIQEAPVLFHPVAGPIRRNRHPSPHPDNPAGDLQHLDRMFNGDLGVFNGIWDDLRNLPMPHPQDIAVPQVPLPAQAQNVFHAPLPSIPGERRDRMPFTLGLRSGHLGDQLLASPQAPAAAGGPAAPAAQDQDNTRLSFRYFYERLRNAANNEPQLPAVAGNEALSNPLAPNLADELRLRADFARPPRVRGPAAERRRAMREEETIRIADEQERYHEQRDRLA